jgi:mRNA-degrading endonuclease toxin of MazEF toxin-antitoxin module
MRLQWSSSIRSSREAVLTQHIGTLSPAKIDALNRAIRIAVDLLE